MNTIMALKKVFYGTSKIQTLRRVALDANLLATLGLDVGDLLNVELDIENETVLLTRANSSTRDDTDRHLVTRRSRANK